MRTKHLLHAWTFSLACIGIACSGNEPPRRDCTTLVWAKPDNGTGAVLAEGSWDGWASRQPLTLYRDGYYVLPLTLPPGEYGYRLVEDGKPRLDVFNPLTTFKGEDEVSLAIAQDCSAPELRVDDVRVDGDAITVRGTFLATPDGAAMDAGSLRATLPDGTEIAPREADASNGTFSFTTSGLARGKYTLALSAKDGDGRAASARAAAWVEPAHTSWSGGLLYHLMVDRFRGDGGKVLAPPATPGSRAGGTLDGVRAEIAKGTFDALGVTAIWLSPVYENPIEIREGRDGHLYESYHGYWPLDSRRVDARIGGEEALHELIAEAHRHGIRIIFDIVPNHVYENNEVYLRHRNSGWFNDGPDRCVCGTPGCGWGEKLPTCWFTSYLPDVRYQNPDAMRWQVGDATWWMNAFDADGVRIDAVPMMPRAATRRIVHAMKESVAGHEALFTIGEVFTGPGVNGIDSIRYFLGPYALGGAFDFPLMWMLRDVVAGDRAGFSDLESIMAETDAAIYGSGSALGHMVDNHDTSRFISEAVGNAGNDPWSNPPAQPDDPAAYARTRMALAFILTLPGLPVLYYGDELAMAGAGDPDSRRVMPDLDALPAPQKEVLALTRRLGTLRRCSTALREGEREPLVVGPQFYAYRRDAGDGDPVLVFFSKAKASTKIPVPAGAVKEGAYVDVITGESLSLGNGSGVPLDPLSFRVLLPAGSPCAKTSP
jgi:glycosidase